MTKALSHWTDEEIAYVKFLLTQGLSRAEMAVEMTKRFPRGRPYTKNVLVGIVNRLDQEKGHVPVARTTRSTSQKQAPSLPKLRPSRAILVINAKEERYEPKGTCTYILNDDPPYQKCGKECRGSWCEEHKKLVTIKRVA